MEVPCKSATWITDVIESQANGDREIVSGERGLRPRVLVTTEGNSIGGGQDLLAVGRGAAHSNTQEGRD